MGSFFDRSIDDLEVTDVYPEALNHLVGAKFYDLRDAREAFGGAFMTTSAAANRLGVTRETVRVMIQERQCAFLQLSNKRFFVSRKDVERLAKTRKKIPQRPYYFNKRAVKREKAEAQTANENMSLFSFPGQETQ